MYIHIYIYIYNVIYSEANANVQVPLSERVGNIVRSAAARLGDITPGTRRPVIT